MPSCTVVDVSRAIWLLRGQTGFYGLEALYTEYQQIPVKIVHPLRIEEYGMKEFMIADLEGNTINFGELVERE